MKFFALSPALLMAVALAGCTDQGESVVTPPPDDQTPAVSFANDIQPIFDANCVGCHGAGASGGLDLRAAGSRAALVNVPAAGYTGTRVVPGDPLVSILYRKLQGDPTTGARMPFGGAALPPAQVQLVHDWIEQGALAN
jgi:mono/diheme cytochrome c family protein